MPEEQEELWPQLDPLEAECTFEPEFRACHDLLALAWEYRSSSDTVAEEVTAKSLARRREEGRLVFGPRLSYVRTQRHTLSLRMGILKVILLPVSLPLEFVEHSTRRRRGRRKSGLIEFMAMFMLAALAVCAIAVLVALLALFIIWVLLQFGFDATRDAYLKRKSQEPHHLSDRRASRARSASVRDAKRASRSRQTSGPSSIPMPARVTDAWIRENVPRLNVNQIRDLTRALKGRGWTDAELATRVRPYAP